VTEVSGRPEAEDLRRSQFKTKEYSANQSKGWDAKPRVFTERYDSRLHKSGTEQAALVLRTGKLYPKTPWRCAERFF
jgi:hypothetical protein